MQIAKYGVRLVGKVPGLLMHWDNLTWADELKAWRARPENQKTCVRGDDRSPAWSWIGSVYNDGEVVGMPADNIARAIMQGGALVPVPGARRGRTFKAQTQSGMMPTEAVWPLYVGGKTIAMEEISKLREESEFSAHLEAVKRMGFGLDVRRAAVGATKHIRVRPVFRQWELRGSITVWDEQITLPVLADFMRMAGLYKGIGDWRPSSPKSPGPFGLFDAEVTEQEP